MTNHLTIDLPQLCAKGQALDGVLSFNQAPRLSMGAMDGQFDWRLQGELLAERSHPQYQGLPSLRLQIDGSAKVDCVRCLTPFVMPIQLKQRFIAFQSEEQADQELLEDETFDPIVASSTFDLQALIEDEILMAIGESPTHPVCPPEALAALGKSANPEPVADTVAKENPFAALMALKKN